MVRYRRFPVAGGTYFFTVVLQDRSAGTLTANIDCLRAAFRKAHLERPFTTDAIVILPDHLHAIMTLPDGDADFALRWQRNKTHFTQAVRRGGSLIDPRDKTGRALWQRRFWEHTIRDATDLARHIDYIHFNPVRHGYVAKPADWPHTSLHRFIKRGMIPADSSRDLALDRPAAGPVFWQRRQFWMSLPANYDLAVARRDFGETIVREVEAA